MRTVLRRLVAVSAALVLAVLCCLTTASALDDKYEFEEFGMSVKVPKNYRVITRSTPRGDDVFAELGLNYDELMTAFRAANIYMRAYAPDDVFQISMTVTRDENSEAINNYTDLTTVERKEIADVLLAEPGVTSAVEVKHGGNIFFDSTRETTVDDTPVYISQCNTVINGRQFDLILQKSDEAILPDETKVLTNIASSFNFDKIILRDSGPVFEWWRLLLWVVILVAISVACSYLYRQYNAANRRKLQERRDRRQEQLSRDSNHEADDEPREITFDEALGYTDSAEFTARADTDLDSYDINVRERDPSLGVSYFEDAGESIDDRTDYFDTYFKSPTERRSGMSRLLSTVGAYIGIAIKHIGYFFQNLFRAVFRRKK